MNDLPPHILRQLERVNRRQFLGSLSMGVGAAALSQWSPLEALAQQTQQTQQAQQAVEAPQPSPHHLPRAKRVIFLCMAGGPSHLETFDDKPRLRELDGTPMPESFITREMDVVDVSIGTQI